MLFFPSTSGKGKTIETVKINARASPGDIKASAKFNYVILANLGFYHPLTRGKARGKRINKTLCDSLMRECKRGYLKWTQLSGTVGVGNGLQNAFQ